MASNRQRREVASDCGQKELLLGSCASWVPTCDFVFPSIIRSICLCREIKKCAVWQTSDNVLETDRFCVRNAAQSFLRLGKRTQVLYSTSNKRSTRCDPDNTFHTKRSFLVLAATHVPAQEKHHASFSNPCDCQISSTNNIHLLPNVSKVALDEFLCDVFVLNARLDDSSLTRRRCFAASSTNSTLN